MVGLVDPAPLLEPESPEEELPRLEELEEPDVPIPAEAMPCEALKRSTSFPSTWV